LQSFQIVFVKDVQNESLQFILQITFGSIFNTCHGAPILCGTTTDFGIFYVKQFFLVLFLGFLELHLREPWQGKSMLRR